MVTMKKYLYLLFLTAFSITSCIEDVSINPIGERTIVVECILVKDTVQILHLYEMANLYESKITPVENAKISLLRLHADKRDTVATFKRKEREIWLSCYEPDFGSHYILEIVTENGDTIKAATTFPEDLRLISSTKSMRSYKGAIKTDIDTISYVCKSSEVHIGHYTEMILSSDRLYAREDGKPFKAYNLPYEGSCKMWIYPHADNTFFGPPGSTMNYLREEEYVFRGTDQPNTAYAVTDHPGADNFNIVPGKLSDLDVCLVSEKDNAYLSQYGARHELFYQWYLNNCPNLPLHNHFVRINHPAGFTNGLKIEDIKDSYHSSQHSFFITADYADTYPPYRYVFGKHTPNLASGCVNEVRFLSDEYDSFLRDIVVQSMNNDNFVLSEYDYHNIYSNVQGGFGIFGAELVTWEEPELIQ